ncbi:arrestin (or S-antigen), N-terminal domain protein [Paecilomyces variotii No. 5]|uniref:Arrestin (Or S-antigen), N-terminal domain protein n=1 Tax=Byssochlamys spectabilis (strain No. 5 / NBRC 109023) TaxID=1356009 RepID=V5G4A4_BYSSN|nr:arrestin (or S-antigen), N-terminal domain protein [Paecilomyces variotii No. 5]
MSASSFIARSTSTFESLTKRSRPKVEIDLVDQRDGFVASYTTGDRIEGEVTIVADHDTQFDDIDITFEGSSTTSVERSSSMVGSSGKSNAYQTFLKLRQPISQTEYPHPRVFEAGQTFRFPFTFVVPDRLLPQVCDHSKNNLHLRYAHTQLPPSLGDPMLAGDGVSLLDDMAPLMSRISYVIKVSISRKPSGDGGRSTNLASVAKKIRIIPVVDEQPPLSIADDCDDYCLRKEKDVKRGLLRGKYGRLVIQASQPRPLQGDFTRSNGSSCPASTVATLHLRFDPVADEQPPRLGTLWTKMKASTFYSIIPWDSFPSKSSNAYWMNIRGAYTETVPLSSRCIASAQWEKHPNNEDNAISRRTSMQSASSIESLTGPSASYSGKTFYTASVLVPITLPKSKSFVPTFHSCLISRTYTLDLCVSYHTPNTNVLTPSSSLRVPIQVTCGRPDRSTNYHDEEAGAETEEEEQDFFRPRSIAPPNHENLGSTGSLSGISDNNASRPADPPMYSDPMSLSRSRRHSNRQYSSRLNGESGGSREKSGSITLLMPPI